MYVSTDVLQWLDWREYHNKPTLKRYLDYVIVPLEVMSEFDDFKAQLPKGHLYLPSSKLVFVQCKSTISVSLINAIFIGW